MNYAALNSSYQRSDAAATSRAWSADTRNRLLTNTYGRNMQLAPPQQTLMHGATPPSFLRPRSAQTGGSNVNSSSVYHTAHTPTPAMHMNSLPPLDHGGFAASAAAPQQHQQGQQQGQGQQKKGANNQLAKLASAAAIKIAGYVPPMDSARGDGAEGGAAASGLGMSDAAVVAAMDPQQVLLQQQQRAAQTAVQEARTAEEQRRREVDAAAVAQAFEKAQQHLAKLWQEAQVPQDERDDFAHRVWTGSNLIASTTKTLEEIERLLQIRDAEIRVEKAIEIRQGFLYLLQELSDRYSTGKIERDQARKELGAIVAPLRKSTCDVVEAVEGWNALMSAAVNQFNQHRQAQQLQAAKQHHHTPSSQASPSFPLKQHNPHLYAWRGVNYCEKMLGDVAFLGVSRTRLLLDWEPVSNPLMRGPKMFVGINRREASLLQDRVLRASAFLQAVAESVARDAAVGGDQHQQQQQQRLQQMGTRSVLSQPVNSGNAFRDVTSGYGAVSAANNGGGNSAAGVATDRNRKGGPRQKLAQTLDVVQGFSMAASRIQAMFRGFQCRCRYHALLREHAAARVIQRAARRFVARCVTERLRRRRNAATRIQALHRGNAVRARIAQSLEQVRAATAIQRVFRGFLTRRQVRVIRYVVERATAIQRVYRGHRVRRSVETIQFHRQHAAATRIQALFRGYRVRCRPRFNYRIVPAIVRLQAWFRGVLARARVRRLQRRRSAAVTLQAWARGMAVRARVQGLRVQLYNEAFERLRETEERAAVAIQRTWRGFDARLKYGRGGSRRQHLSERVDARQRRAELGIVQLALQQEREDQQRWNAAATAIQARWRCFSTRREYVLSRYLDANATRIQALARGFLTRRHNINEPEPEPRDFSIVDLIQNYEAEEAAAAAAAAGGGAVSPPSQQRDAAGASDEDDGGLYDDVHDDADEEDDDAAAQRLGSTVNSVIAVAHAAEEEETARELQLGHAPQPQPEPQQEELAVSPIARNGAAAAAAVDADADADADADVASRIEQIRVAERAEAARLAALHQQEALREAADRDQKLQRENSRLREEAVRRARIEDMLRDEQEERRAAREMQRLADLQKAEQQEQQRLRAAHEAHAKKVATMRLSLADDEEAERSRTLARQLAAWDELLAQHQAATARARVQQRESARGRQEQRALQLRLALQDTEHAGRAALLAEEHVQRSIYSIEMATRLERIAAREALAQQEQQQQQQRAADLAAADRRASELLDQMLSDARSEAATSARSSSSALGVAAAVSEDDAARRIQGAFRGAEARAQRNQLREQRQLQQLANLAAEEDEL